MKNAEVLVTGVTGFVGKVVLEELLRRREELGVSKIHVVIRRARGKSGVERFAKIAVSPCFSGLAEGWKDRVHVVEADLADAEGLRDFDALAARLTHVIHCAASVEFDLPMADAARANIDTALNVLAFARRCPKLVRMVSVSTAYVTPHTSDTTPVLEERVPLPRPARVLNEEVRVAHGAEAAEKRLLTELRLPNTYTLSKCVAEHLLLDERGSVPLTIVRPSIVSACLERPFPGWIDSRAALAGFVTLIGMGYLRAVVVDPKTRLDIMPCDEVAARILRAAFEPEASPTAIRHAVAGLSRSNTIQTCCDAITSYYRRYPFERRSKVNYLGPPNRRFMVADLVHHRIPLKVGQLVLKKVKGDRAGKKIATLSSAITKINDSFPYFTQSTFDFRSSMPLAPTFDAPAYMELVCEGVDRHLLGREPRRSRLGGRREVKAQDLGFVATQPRGSLTVRALGYLLKKGLRACVEEVTFDQPSFERAMKDVPSDSLVVIVPTHRSYMDFLLCPLLFFSKPHLGIAPPKIAAAEEFARIPILGKVFELGGAFFVQRGVGRASPELNQKVRNLVGARETLMFFIEGKRSRDRKFLSPRTGLLRALHETGQRFTLLPVSISYDRVPEEGALLRELKSDVKPPMRLRPLLAWLGRVARGHVSLGHVHLACGRPITLDSESNVRAVAQAVMGELQATTVTTTHHLAAFLKQNALAGVDLEWLKAAITRRGGLVLESTLPLEETMDPMLEGSLRNNWKHLFHADALGVFFDDPELLAAIEQSHFGDLSKTPQSDADDPRLAVLLGALFGRPVPSPARINAAGDRREGAARPSELPTSTPNVGL